MSELGDTFNKAFSRANKPKTKDAPEAPAAPTGAFKTGYHPMEMPDDTSATHVMDEHDPKMGGQ